MLRIARAAKSSSTFAQTRRYAHGVHYGPAEPVGYYVKWIAAIGGFVGLVTYDRFYSDRKISKMLTPATDVAALNTQRDKFEDTLIQERDRNVELLYPRARPASLQIFSASPVPAGSHRDKHTNAVIDTETLGERRLRS